MNEGRKRNLTMLTDFYELTMANGYFQNGFADRIAYFDLFFRKVPDGGGFAIMAGLEQLIDYLKDLHFTEEDIAFLRGKGIFDEAFLQFLRNFSFSCDVWAVPEGTPVFPHEPIVTVRGPVIQAQFIETMVLLAINHPSLIATKANRICRAAKGRPVMEFGSRRAQGYDGAVYGARAAYIGGCVGTACTIASGISASPPWVLWPIAGCRCLTASFPPSAPMPGLSGQLHSFGGHLSYPQIRHSQRHPDFQEEILPRGFRPAGVRIDSGDITYLSKKPVKCSMRQASPTARSSPPIPWMS